MKIAVIVGSLRRQSLNEQLARSLVGLAGAAAEFEFLSIDLPLFNQDLEADFPAAAAKFKQAIAAADGVMVATPEYNRGIPGPLKNAIDWSSRPAGDNPWRGKPVAVVGATPGLLGTALAQADLKRVLSFLGAKVMATPELYLANADKTFDQDGQADPEEQEYLAGYMAAFLDFVKES
jgi:chromate reductase